MQIEIKKSDGAVVIDGDDAKFAEMIAVHGAGNVTVLDAEPVEEAPKKGKTKKVEE